MACIDLQWALRRHQDVYAGIRDYARGKTNWDLRVDPWFNFGAVDLRAEGIDAAIGRLEPEILGAVRRARLPCVTTRRHPIDKLPDVARVLEDDAGVIRAAVEHLAQRGYRRVEYVRIYPRRLALRERALAEMSDSCGIPHRSTHLPHAELTATGLHREFDRWLDTLVPPVGVVADTDHVATWLIAACMERGLRVPEQVGVIGVGNDEGYCLANEPTLTSVDANSFKVGFAAAKALDLLLAGKAGPDLEQIIAPAGVVTRQSTDSLCTDDKIVARAFATIRERFREDLTIAEISRASGQAVRTLQMRFQRVTGRSIADHLAQRRADNAMHLLTHTDWPLERIAMSSGFGSARRMHRTFAKLHRRAPGTFRTRA